MPRCISARSTLGVLLATLACAAPASAQTPASPSLQPNTITVTGSATVKPKPENRKSSTSIAAAVEAAEQAAVPLALTDGRTRATELARLAGMTLGSLLAIADAPASPYGYFGPFGQEGTFGPGRYCGTVRTPVFRTTKSGRRKVVRFRKRHTCRVPTRVSASFTMTFAATPGPAPAA